MTQTDILFWGLGLVWGAAIGLFYFWGLWRTLLVIQKRSRPKLWLGLSYALRTVVALTGFWVVMRKDLTAFFFTLGGFFFVRFFLTRRLGVMERGQGHAD